VRHGQRLAGHYRAEAALEAGLKIWHHFFVADKLFPKSAAPNRKQC
jgi:hypothetical protein